MIFGTLKYMFAVWLKQTNKYLPIQIFLFRRHDGPI